MLIYITVLLLTAPVPTLLGVFSMILVVFITGSKVAIRTKRLSENLVNLRSQYRDLVTERYLGWKTIKTFNTLENEKQILGLAKDTLEQDNTQLTQDNAKLIQANSALVNEKNTLELA